LSNKRGAFHCSGLLFCEERVWGAIALRLILGFLTNCEGFFDEALFCLSKNYPLMPEAMEKFLVELFSKSSWVSRGQRPLVAHRSARNLFKPSLFSGVNQKNAPPPQPPYAAVIQGFRRIFQHF
jgi:hypothetical protein